MEVTVLLGQRKSAMHQIDEAKARRDSPDNAEDAIVEVVESERASGEEDIQRVLQELRAHSRALPVIRVGADQHLVSTAPKRQKLTPAPS